MSYSLHLAFKIADEIGSLIESIALQKDGSYKVSKKYPNMMIHKTGLKTKRIIRQIDKLSEKQLSIIRENNCTMEALN